MNCFFLHIKTEVAIAHWPHESRRWLIPFPLHKIPSISDWETMGLSQQKICTFILVVVIAAIASVARGSKSINYSGFPRFNCDHEEYQKYCRPHAVANPYVRGCLPIDRCRPGTNWRPKYNNMNWLKRAYTLIRVNRLYIMMK